METPPIFLKPSELYLLKYNSEGIEEATLVKFEQKMETVYKKYAIVTFADLNTPFTITVHLDSIVKYENFPEDERV